MKFIMRAYNETLKGLPLAKKRLAELELSLLHLHQNTEIPEIQLLINEHIKKTINTAKEKQIPVSPALLGTLAQDTTFLNRLQSDVNIWIKEIQTVSLLSRDIGSGTAAQEISFWMALESHLLKIEEKLSSEPVRLTLDVLKNAKRYHATVSFLADTGIKEAMEKVQKYNLVMKVRLSGIMLREPDVV